MANLVRNDLTIEGENVKQVLDYIGFNPDGSDPSGVPIIRRAGVQADNIAVLIDFNRIVPPPNDPPDQGWAKWVSDNWGTSPYDGASPGDILELTERRACFTFYSKWTPALPLIEALAKRFPEFKFHLWSWEQTNHLWGEAAWENGQRTLFVPLFGMKLQSDDDVPANDPITEEIKAMAATSVKGALDAYKGCTLPNGESSIAAVAELIAVSGHSVRVKVEPNGDGTCCLYVDARGAK